MSIDTPLVSVVIPAYNHENYIQDAVCSIILQTYNNIELIVIDDGSKDLTWEKLKQLEASCKERFVRVVFKTRNNKGICSTLNELIEIARGDYIFHIASDDVAKPDVISTEVDFLNKNPDYGFCVGDNDLIDSEGRICYLDRSRNVVHDINAAAYRTFGDYLKSERSDVDFDSEEFGKYYTFIKGGNYVPNGFLVRKSIYEKIGHYTSEAALEDLWLMLQVSKYSKLKYINQVLFSYRQHSSNTINDKQKMNNATYSTFLYESKVLETIRMEDVLPGVSQYIQDYIVTKQKGLKYLFEIIYLGKLKQDKNSYPKHVKIKKIKFLNMVIFQRAKTYDIACHVRQDYIEHS